MHEVNVCPVVMYATSTRKTRVSKINKQSIRVLYSMCISRLVFIIKSISVCNIFDEINNYRPAFVCII